jgi:hypothetical protein
MPVLVTKVNKPGDVQKAAALFLEVPKALVKPEDAAPAKKVLLPRVSSDLKDFMNEVILVGKYFRVEMFNKTDVPDRMDKTKQSDLRKLMKKWDNSAEYEEEYSEGRFVKEIAQKVSNILFS